MISEAGTCPAGWVMESLCSCLHAAAAHWFWVGCQLPLETTREPNPFMELQGEANDFLELNPLRNYSKRLWSSFSVPSLHNLCEGGAGFVGSTPFVSVLCTQMLVQPDLCPLFYTKHLFPFLSLKPLPPWSKNILALAFTLSIFMDLR